MDTAELFVLLAGVSLIGFTLWFFFGQRDNEPQRRTMSQPSKSVIYACPMHPWITSTDATANCSICGMKLTRRDE